ncbi:DUF488 family protein [Nitrosovibrio tenuis]|uniref:DUF488 domain-containing protein n=1 Tax=Nitrosovibrio tenuis TaxID=1233 RepID=A0A1H7P9B3_9PROT|nr:DUF488 domain-containing protein [Nitrosovibrio tenuis]SEL32390.1 Protein of unknown function, DUF488 [Nitrosovibrio tenuis]
MTAVYSIGHSNHDINTFIALLKRYDISALADVRSHPYSRFAPQYSRETLKVSLADAGIAYVFLGKELGARSDDPACYLHGKVQYDRLAKQPGFRTGIQRINEGMNRYSIALMCSEKDPLDCHRALLVARNIFDSGISIDHIHADGVLESHEHLESRLLAICKLPEGDMFKAREQFVAEAYFIQGQRVAYQDEAMRQEEQLATS